MKYLCQSRRLKLILAATLMTLSSLAAALEIKPFSAATLSSLQQEGKPVAVHFHADWCPTCVNQSKSFETLKSDSQLSAMTVLTADYDKEKELRKSMKVPSQSVIVVFKGSQEVARLNGQTKADPIKTALLKAL